MIGKQEIIGETIAKIMSETSVTSVTSTDQGQIILPERQGAYKRRILDGLEAFKFDKKMNDKYTDEQLVFIETLYNDISTEFNIILSPLIFFTCFIFLHFLVQIQFSVYCYLK